MGVLKIIGIIFLVIILLIAGGGFYFYNFYVFKTLRTCISNTARDTQLTCNSNENCVDLFLSNSTEFKQTIETAPDFIQAHLNEVITAAVVCEQTCKIKEIYGVFTGEEAESCRPGEQEILLEIHGKEGVQFINYMREQVIEA